MKLNKGLFLCFILFFSNDALAQQEKLSLKILLQTLEKRYDVSFTYLDIDIADVLIPNPPGELSLTESLQFLQKNTVLAFTQLDQRFITISKSLSNNTSKVCGVLFDSNNKEKIAGAVIHGGGKSAISNADGYFEIPGLTENDTLSIQSLGYLAKTFLASELRALPCKTIVLDIQFTTLPEIVITNYLTEGINKKSDGSLTIQTEGLGILPGLTEPDVLHSIQALPGIQSVDETVSNINVRGGTHDQNLVLWNGIKMYQFSHFFGLISAFNPYLTREVTLLKNGTSAALNDGVSSTIAIESDDDVGQKLTGGAGVNLINADVFVKIPMSKKAALHVSSRRSLADIVQTPTYRTYYKRAFRDTDLTNLSSTGDSVVATDEKFFFYDYSVKFIYNITPNDEFRINFLNIKNNIEYRENAFVNNQPESKTSSLSQQNAAAGISYNHLWNERIRTSGQLYFSIYNLDAINFDVINDQRLIQENEVLDVGFKMDTRVSLNRNWGIFTGYQFFEVGVSNLDDINNPVFRRYIKNVLRSHAVFTEINFNSSDGPHETDIRAGVRMNYQEKFHKIIFEPRLSLNQKFLNHFSLEILGELKNQTTTQVIDFQNDFLGIEKRRWIVSNNEDVPIIKSKQLSAGIHFNKINFLITLESYLKRVDGIISSSQGFQNQFQYSRSAGAYDATGVDFLVNKKFTKLNFWVSYSYANNNFRFEEFTPSVFPNNLHIKHTASAGSSYQVKQFQASVGLSWHTGRPFTEPLNVVDHAINYKTPNSSRLDKYLRIDFSAKYNFKLGNTVRGLVGISFWNLFDRKNAINAYYQLDSNDQVHFVEKNALGFTPNFIVRVSF